MGRCLLGEDEPVTLRVCFEHAQPETFPDQRAHWLRHTRFARVDRSDGSELRERDEAAHADIDDDTTSVRVDHRRVDDLPRMDELLHTRPRTPIASAPEGENDSAVRPLRVDDRRDDAIANAQFVSTATLAQRNDTRRPITEVDRRLVTADVGDGPLDSLAAPQGP